MATNKEYEDSLLTMYKDEESSIFGDFFKQMKPQDKYEIVKEGYENDFGRVDKPLGTLADRIADFWGGSPEADARARYLDTLKELNKQGGGRGGTKLAQGEMDRMDKRHRIDQDEKIKEEEKIKKELDEKIKAEKEREEFLDSPKGRMQTMFNDADKRDAILGGIADAMLETRTGADAYGNRFARAQKNVRDNLKISEATDIARQQAQLDAMKTMAETQKLTDPRQYLTNAQTEASSYVNSLIRAGKIKPEDFNTEYAKTLKQIAVKDLTSAKASSIKDLYAFAITLEQSDPDTAKLLKEAIRSNAAYLAGDSSGGGASGEVGIEATDYTD